jgi:hypothetical protein
MERDLVFCGAAELQYRRQRFAQAAVLRQAMCLTTAAAWGLVAGRESLRPLPASPAAAAAPFLAGLIVSLLPLVPFRRLR